MTEPEKMSGESLDVAAAKRAELKRLLPAAFTETADEDGNLVESVDFERLKAELGEFTELFERRRERYGMEWPGKSDCLKVIQEKSRATLKPCRGESVDFDHTENLFLEGDNLEVLKLLQKSYHGQVKMIYIDPPYNTGNEFIYPDNFTESLDTYLDYAGMLDEQGRHIESKKNRRDEGRFHTKWLNMMYPRLYLARNLLRDDGVVFISIDDNEVSNLRKLCDEVFGEENFVADVVWEKMYTTKNDSSLISHCHEYVIVYAKVITSESIGLLPRTTAMDARYSNPDNDPRGNWKAIPMYADGERKNGRFTITSPTGKAHEPEPNTHWRYTEKDVLKLIKDGRVWFGKTGNSQPNLKRFLSEVQHGTKSKSLWKHSEAGSNDTASRELKSLFGKLSPFSFPKPTSLLCRMLRLGTIGTDDIILDFFSGSCTTAQAVLDLNREDGGNRKFIMVQLPEPCDDDSEAAKAGYKTIADIGKERIRRVIKKITTENTEHTEKEKTENPLFHQENASGSSESSVLRKQDLGFRVLKLDKSNFKAWQPLPADAGEEKIKQALQDHLFHVDETSTPEDILFEILLKAGYMPSTGIETLTLAGKTVYSVAAGVLFICLEDEITRELIDAVAEKLPQQFICLDRGFQGNDQLKANSVQTFNALNESKDKDSKIIFRTV